ncbi:MAG: hypothetical protein ACKOVB_13625 [Terrabacter sp.]
MPPPPPAAALRVQLACPPQWEQAATTALAVAGVVVTGDAAVGVSIGPGRTVSATVDDWTVASLPHLLVAVTSYAVDLGPWAAPGLGPCARCVAAEVLDEGDPDRLPDLPRALLAMAAGAAARDLGTWARGELPPTWLTSWRLDHEPVPTARRWQRHPYCGCDWFDTA